MKHNSKFCLFLAVLCVLVLNLFGCSEELPQSVKGGGNTTNLNYLPDSDGDGWTPLSDAELSEFGVLKSPLKKGDCDDTDGNVYPGAPEIVDGKDSDCDGVFGPNECANDTACDDDDECTSNDICEKGICVGKSVDCDDQNLCTIDSCDPADGKCVNETKSCSDDNLCTTDSCDPATGECVYTNNTVVCNDGNVCTTDDICADGACSAGAPLACDDSNVCNGTETCDPATGCVLGESLVCNDMNVCTTDTCDALAGCQYIIAPCDDQNLCTTDSCDAATGCAFAQKDCDDSKECTADLCDPATGECKSLIDVGATCTSDNDACTTDTCNSAGECVHNVLVCDDSNICNGVETCNPATGCVLGVALNCNDDNLCTDDICVPATGCQHTANSNQCTDNTVCTNGDVCANGVCVPGPALNCNDGDACTDDACDPILGCSNTAVPECCYNDTMCQPVPDQLPEVGYLWGCSEEGGLAGECTSCEDMDLPPQGPDGVCASKESLCDDGWDGDADLLIDCLDDDCDDALCDDGDTCTTGDVCTAGECVGGAPLNCDDANPCTTDSCVAGGCQHVAAVCNDQNACTTDTCNPATGCVYTANAAACDDGDTCTTDSCDPAIGCVFAPIADCCHEAADCAASDVCVADTCVLKALPGVCQDFVIEVKGSVPNKTALFWYDMFELTRSGFFADGLHWSEPDECSAVAMGFASGGCTCYTFLGESPCGEMPGNPGLYGCWTNKPAEEPPPAP